MLQGASRQRCMLQTERAESTRDLRVGEVRNQNVSVSCRPRELSSRKIIKWWVLSMNLEDSPQVNPNAGNWYMCGSHTAIIGGRLFWFREVKWLVQVHSGVPFARWHPMKSPWHQHFRCVALNSSHKRFLCFCSQMSTSAKLLAFSNAKLPPGVTSALLKEEISPRSIIRSKWFWERPFSHPQPVIQNVMESEGETEDKCPHSLTWKLVFVQR